MALTILSFGAGQDSQTIAAKLILDPAFRSKYAPGELIAIMADTGNEHPHTLDHVAKMRPIFEAAGIPFFFVGDEFRAPSWQGGLLGQWSRGRASVGSKAYVKSCTDKLKIQPIYKCLADYLEGRGFGSSSRKKSLYAYTAEHGKIKVLIGIAAGEEKRANKSNSGAAKWMLNNIEIEYPLLDLGMDRSACQSFLHSVEQDLGVACPMPSNCMYCPFNQEFDLVWLKRNHPAKLEEWIGFEDRKIEAWSELQEPEKNLGVWGKAGISLRDKVAEAVEQYGDMSDKDLNEYKFSHGHCVSSAY